jgi:hypothetical protein
MKSPHGLTPTHLQLLRAIASEHESNLLKIRTNLTWDVERFATTLHSLESLNLIVRVAFKASCTEMGLRTLIHDQQSAIKKDFHLPRTSNYLDEIKLPPLSVTEPWLPNMGNFRRATRNKT